MSQASSSFFHDNQVNLKYASAMAAQSEAQGRREFLEKCETICPPPASMLPHTPEEWVPWSSFRVTLQCITVISWFIFRQPLACSVKHLKNLTHILILERLIMGKNLLQELRGHSIHWYWTWLWLWSNCNGTPAPVPDSHEIVLVL